MEIIIAIGLGLWFIVCGLAAYIAYSKDFKK